MKKFLTLFIFILITQGVIAGNFNKIEKPKEVTVEQFDCNIEKCAPSHKKYSALHTEGELLLSDIKALEKRCDGMIMSVTYPLQEEFIKIRERLIDLRKSVNELIEVTNRTSFWSFTWITGVEMKHYNTDCTILKVLKAEHKHLLEKFESILETL